MTNVFLPVLEHVEERRTHLAGRAQGTGMETVCPDGAPSRERAIDAARDANLERRDPSESAIVVFGLHDQVA